MKKGQNKQAGQVETLEQTQEQANFKPAKIVGLKLGSLALPETLEQDFTQVIGQGTILKDCEIELITKEGKQAIEGTDYKIVGNSLQYGESLAFSGSWLFYRVVGDFKTLPVLHFTPRKKWANGLLSRGFKPENCLIVKGMPNLTAKNGKVFATVGTKIEQNNQPSENLWYNK